MSNDRMVDARDVGLSYLMSLGIDLAIPPSPSLITWIESWPEVNDESTYMQHPVFALPEQSNSVEMKLLSIMVMIRERLQQILNRYAKLIQYERFIDEY